ncbi:hypothetical protein GCM10009670_14130 [Citricoccus alkalitolerans]
MLPRPMKAMGGWGPVDARVSLRWLVSVMAVLLAIVLGCFRGSEGESAAFDGGGQGGDLVGCHLVERGRLPLRVAVLVHE